MKISAVIGSSKQGNTTELVRYITEILTREIPRLQVKFLYLSDFPIAFCTGCHQCIFSGEELCPHTVQRALLEQEMLDSDAVILASPGYMFSVTGIMKNFLDHVAYNCHRPKYFGKYLMLVSACNTWQEKSVFAPMKTWGEAAGFSRITQVYGDMLPLPMSKLALDKQRRKLERAANEFSRYLKEKPLRKLKLGDLMVFKAFRILSSTAPNLLKADSAYYSTVDSSQSWHREAKVPVIPLVVSRIIGSRMEKSITALVDMKAAAHTTPIKRVNKLKGGMS